MEVFLRCMSEGIEYCLWILFSDSDLVKTAYKFWYMQYSLKNVVFCSLYAVNKLKISYNFVFIYEYNNYNYHIIYMHKYICPNSIVWYGLAANSLWKDKKMTSLKKDKWSYNCTNYRRKIGCVLKKSYCCPEKCIKYTPLKPSPSDILRSSTPILGSISWECRII